MNMESKQDYVKYRLKKSEEALLASDLLIDHEMWNAAINRLYYASFYAVSALLYLNDIEVKSHKSVRIQFFKEFVKPGKISKQNGKLFSDLFDWRQTGDYGDLSDFSKEDVMSIVEPVKDFLTAIYIESGTLP